MPIPEALPAEEVHVFCTWPERLGPQEIARIRDTWLTADDRVRCDRFRFPQGQRECIAARALARLALSRYRPVPPLAWRFDAGPQGRPEIAAPEEGKGLFFNLSHSHGLVACAVAAFPLVGIDVEWTGRSTDLMELADRYFTPAESTALRALPEDARADRFFRLWTVKEACLKAMGLGLTGGLDRLAVTLGRGSEVSVEWTPGPDRSEAPWRVELFAPAPGYACAVAASALHADRLRVTVHEADLLALP